MARTPQYDEVMIVNPVDPDRGFQQGVRLMNYYAGQPGMGYYAGWPAGYAGYSADPNDGMQGYGQVYPYGYAEAPELMGWGYPYGVAPGYTEPEPVGYYADEVPMGYTGEPEGYGETDAYGDYGLAPQGDITMPYPPRRPRPQGGRVSGLDQTYIDPSVQGYADPEMAGFVRDGEPRFNAGCPMPTNVAGYEEAAPLEGYVAPRGVSPSCGNLSPGPMPSGSEPETFRPLW